MKLASTWACAGLLAALFGRPADAAMMVSIGQVGADVIATAAGWIDLTGLVDDDSFFLTTGVRGDPGYVAVGTGQNTEAWNGVSGPTTFGPGTALISPTSESGDPFGINVFFFQDIFLPRPYVSGLALSGTANFANQTIASLGLITGTYDFTLPADTITVTIGAVSAVPLPATGTLMTGALALLAAGAMARRRHTAAAR